MPVRRTVQPTEEPLTVAEVRTHLRLDYTDDTTTDDAEDAWIERTIRAARARAEALTNRAIARSTWLLTLDSFPCEILLPNPRVISILDIEYTDENGEDQTLDPASYVLDNASEYRNWAETAAGYDWPDTSDDTINNVRVTYTAGYANAEEVPDEIKHWMLLTVATMYKQRETVITGTTVAELPRNFYDALLDAYRVPALA